MEASVEPDGRNDAGRFRRLDDGLSVGARGRERLLQIEVATRSGDRQRKRGMVAARRSDDDRVEIVAGEEPSRVAAEGSAWSRSTSSLERGGIGVGKRGDRDSGGAQEHGEVHGARDRAAPDHSDANDAHG